MCGKRAFHQRKTKGKKEKEREIMIKATGK
jgi:hypothetical protein